MAPSQRSAENFNKKLAAKAKRGIVASGAAGMGKTVNPKDLKPKELPCPHCDRLFKQQDRLKQHVAKHHAKEVEEAAAAAAAVPPKGDGDEGAGSSKPTKPPPGAAATAWEWNGQPQATVFRATTKDPKTILQEYISKKKDVKKPRYVMKEEPAAAGGQAGGVTGWTCKVVLPDKYKPDKDVVIFCDEPCASKEEAAQRAAVAALAKVASNLPLQRLLPAKYKQVFLDHEARERARAAKAAADAEERERRAKKPKARERQELHMSEEKRNLVEGLLRGALDEAEAEAEADEDEDEDFEDARTDEARSASAALAESAARKLRGLGFGEADVAAAMAATESRRLDDSNAALDWLCLNVPEARLPRRFAPSAKNEPIVLMDTAAAFAPAGLRNDGVRGAVRGDASGKSSTPEARDAARAVFDEPRPAEPEAARLYDRGYALDEIRDALAEAAGDEGKAHESLFRAVLAEAAPRDDAWASWPQTEASATPDAIASEEEDSDPWEDEVIAVEAIAGEEAFERVGASCVAVTVESAVGRARLEVTRPKNRAYPGLEPPLVALAPAEAEKNAPPRGALRAATLALAAAAAAAAEDGATCVYELMSLAATALEEHAAAPPPRSVICLTKTQASRSAASGAPDESSGASVSVSSEEKEAAPATAARLPAPRGAAATAPRDQSRGAHRSRAPSKEFIEKENVRLKLAQEAYFGSTRGGKGNGGGARSADASAAKMVASRANLPASGSREEVTAAVSAAPVVVLSGETGCGKSTQVPQFILEQAIEDGRGAETNIVCTQPRRISAIGLAERVAAERLETCGDVVGYSVRLESKLSDKTRLQFCTMGILLRRLLSDPELRGVTHVVLDEVHERSVESDLLLLLLRRLLNRRRDLRVVLMSATADADFFAAYFTAPDAASVAAGVAPTAARKVFIRGFTHPVREYFLEDVLEMTGFLIGKASKWARKKAKGAAGALSADDPRDPSDAPVADVADGSGTVVDVPEDAPAIPDDWEDDDDARAPAPRVAPPLTSALANEDWTAETDFGPGPGPEGATRGRAAARKAVDRERARQDELAEASRRLCEYSDATQRSIANVDESLLNYELIEMLLGAIARAEREGGEGALVARAADGAVPGSRASKGDSPGAVLIFMPGQMEITRLIRDCERSRHLREEDVGRLQFLPLYGALSADDQRRIFARAPPGTRKVVVATNIAETSVTIDDVRYVIDTGRAKEMGYDSTRGLSVLADAWISRAASMQRRGRAGRTAPGACFALFSRRGRANLTPHQPPEMLRTPLQQLCLNIKALAPGGGGIVQTLASAPTPPAPEAVQTALRELRSLRALDAAEALTPLGRHVAHMPVDARIGKMLLFGALLGCLDPILTIAASMAGRSVFVSPKDAKAEADAAKRRLASPGKSDHLTVAAAYAQWQKCGGASARRAFCEKNFLSHMALEGVRVSRQDYAAVLADLGFVSREYLANLKREGVGGGVADRNANVGRVVKAALVAGFYPQVVSVRHPETKFVQTAGGTVERESRDGRELKFFCEDVGRVFLHPASVNAGAGKFESPWLVFGERVETSRVYVRDTTMVGAYALLLFGGDVEVDHERGRVHMDGGWAQFSAPARIGVLVREMRVAVDRLLERHIDAPVAEGEDNLSSSPVVRAVLELLATEGS